MSKHPVQEHIERCIELYGSPIDEKEGLRKASRPREDYEQLRADLILAVGMLIALHRPSA